MKQLLTLILIILTVGVMGQSQEMSKITPANYSMSIDTAVFFYFERDTATIKRTYDEYGSFFKEIFIDRYGNKIIEIDSAYNYVLNLEPLFKEYETECNKDSSIVYQVATNELTEVDGNGGFILVNKYSWVKDTLETYGVVPTARIKYVHKTKPTY